MSKFSKALLSLRESADISQAELGAVLNVSGTAIGRYERDKAKPNLDQLPLIADTLGVSLDRLLR